MSVYYGTLVNSNVVGTNSNVTLTTDTSSVQALVGSLGDEKLVISSLSLWSESKDQLRQRWKIIQKSADGNSWEDTKYPEIDNYQFQNILNNIDFGNLRFDQNTSFEYTILPNTSISFTINIDNQASLETSKPEMVRKATGQPDMIAELIKEYGLIEKEEVKIPEPEPSLFTEKEETKINLPNPASFQEKEEQAVTTEEKQSAVSGGSSKKEEPKKVKSPWGFILIVVAGVIIVRVLDEKLK